MQFIITLVFFFINSKIDVDSLTNVLDVELSHQNKIDTYIKLTKEGGPNIGIYYAKQGIEYCQQRLDHKNEAILCEYLSACYREMGDYSKSIETSYKSINIYEKLNLSKSLALLQLKLGGHLANAKEFEQAIPLLLQAKKYYYRESDSINLCRSLINLGETYRLIDSLQLASTHFIQCLDLCKENNSIRAYALGNLGLVHLAQDSLILAQQELEQSLQLLTPTPDYYSQSYYQAELGELYLRKGETFIIHN